MTKILIVGGGLAGLFTALKLAPRPCLVLTPRVLGEGSSSMWAQGGIAAALDEGDTPEQHAADTIAAGAGLVDADVALGMAQEARIRVIDLLHYGVPFDRDSIGHFLQSKEAAHSQRRIVRVSGDKAGRAIMDALIVQAREASHITLLEGYVAQELLMHEGSVVGVRARGEHGQAALNHDFYAPATVLTTGGIGALYAITTNPLDAQGLGLGMSAQAGARICDPEFVQFHPTAMNIGLDPAPLATEALRGEGATLLNRDGERFMVALHPDAELAPRDIVARGVFASLQAGKGAFLDARTALGTHFAEKFPTVYASCQKGGIDPSVDLIPIAPAAHYHMGGVWTDVRGATSLTGLYAAGEVACTGVHGANRLASNSLLEAIVFGARIADDLREKTLDLPPHFSSLPTTLPAANVEDESVLIQTMRTIMQRDVGVIRNEAGLSRALRELSALAQHTKSLPVKHMLLSALLITKGAISRKESRGAHERSDYPDTDALQADHTTLFAADCVS
jgi:L-aspartate oxidase